MPPECVCVCARADPPVCFVFLPTCLSSSPVSLPYYLAVCLDASLAPRRHLAV